MKATLAIALAAALVLPAQAAPEKTVCTITVNSADEKETLRARLPAGRYRFVELVESGRPDWLRSACTRGVHCDVLVVSGHFNAGETFYSDRLEVSDHLAIDELERASCSGSCPGLFARLKEVYLFGCESLNRDASKYSSAYGESGWERMRRIFAGVPAIYGFSSAAPVGPTAAMLLGRYFDGGAAGAFGTGQVNARLLRVFARNSMTTTRGVGASGPEAQERARICTFFDERLDAAAKLAAVHRAFRASVAHAEPLVARAEKLFAGLTEAERAAPGFVRARAALAADHATRESFLARARAERLPAQRARMVALAHQLGWLDAAQLRAEQAAVVDALLAGARPGFAEVGLACTLNHDRALDGERHRLRPGGSAPRGAGHAALLACMGDADAHAQVVRAIASPRDADVQVAQAYLRHRPLAGEQLRAVAAEVARMPPSDAKVRALDTLARQRISDREVLDAMARSFAQSRSAPVQRAIAGVFLRSDERPPGLARIIREHRLDPPGRGGLVDALAARLAPSG